MLEEARKAELLTIMIATRFLDSIVGNNRFQSIFGSIDHNSMNVTYRVTHHLDSYILLTSN